MEWHHQGQDTLPTPSIKIYDVYGRTRTFKSTQQTEDHTTALQELTDWKPLILLHLNQKTWLLTHSQITMQLFGDNCQRLWIASVCGCQALSQAPDEHIANLTIQPTCDSTSDSTSDEQSTYILQTKADRESYRVHKTLGRIWFSTCHTKG